MRQFKSPEHRRQRAIIVCYTIQRRRGYPRPEALSRAVAMHNRLSGAFAVAEAADWNINPLQLAAQAHAAQYDL